MFAGRYTVIDRLVGFCLAVDRTLLSDLGGFEEGFGLGGYEDDDLCRRIAEKGRALVIVHQSFVHHDGHASFDANNLDWHALQEANRPRFEERCLARSAR